MKKVFGKSPSRNRITILEKLNRDERAYACVWHLPSQTQSLHQAQRRQRDPRRRIRSVGSISVVAGRFAVDELGEGAKRAKLEDEAQLQRRLNMVKRLSEGAVRYAYGPSHQ